MGIKKIITITLAAAIAVSTLTACENILNTSKPDDITFNTPYQYTVTKLGYTKEIWEVTVTGVYAVGKTDVDPDGNCYVMTQVVKPISTGNPDGLAQTPPDVDILFNGEREDGIILSDTCDFDQVRADGYTGAVKGVIGEEYEKVSVQYIMNSDLPNVSGVMLGSLNSKNTFDGAKIIPLTASGIVDYPKAK